MKQIVISLPEVEIRIDPQLVLDMLQAQPIEIDEAQLSWQERAMLKLAPAALPFLLRRVFGDNAPEVPAGVNVQEWLRQLVVTQLIAGALANPWSVEAIGDYDSDPTKIIYHAQRLSPESPIELAAASGGAGSGTALAHSGGA